MFRGGLKLRTHQTLLPMVTPKSQFIQTHPLLAGEGLLIPHQLGGSGLRMNPKPHQLP